MLKSRDALPHILLSVIGIIMVSIVAEGGQYLEAESEAVYMNATRFKWFQWDISNRTLLLMFLLQTKRPLTFRCYGIVYQNRALLLVVHRMLHLCIAFYKCINT
uniref:Uncharacterized protein LOC114337123 n=1 Tax=Diabrotica virgifera virgifera TaxID=50390 RepID=A0A6P7G8X5_DIAVI